MKPDAMIKVRFRTEQEGGRKKAVGGPHFACPMQIAQEKFDCRLYPEGRVLEAGCWFDVPVKFLCPDNALPKLRKIRQFTLWEGKTIADGQLLRVFDHLPAQPNHDLSGAAAV